MRTGQREYRLRVVKSSAGPVRGAVAKGTIQREPNLPVIRIRGGVIQCDMASVAVRFGPGKHAIDVTLAALQ